MASAQMAGFPDAAWWLLRHLAAIALWVLMHISEIVVWRYPDSELILFIWIGHLWCFNLIYLTCLVHLSLFISVYKKLLYILYPSQCKSSATFRFSTQSLYCYSKSDKLLVFYEHNNINCWLIGTYRVLSCLLFPTFTRVYFPCC